MVEKFITVPGGCLSHPRPPNWSLGWLVAASQLLGGAQLKHHCNLFNLIII